MEVKNIKTTVVIASGGFDPIHSGHINYLNEASKLGNYLIVAVNSDAWLVRKKGKAFNILEDINNVFSYLYQSWEKTNSEKLVQEVKKHHRWVAWITVFSEHFPRAFRIFSLAFNVLLLLVVVPISTPFLYVVTLPELNIDTI